MNPWTPLVRTPVLGDATPILSVTGSLGALAGFVQPAAKAAATNARMTDLRHRVKALRIGRTETLGAGSALCKSVLVGRARDDEAVFRFYALIDRPPTSTRQVSALD